MIAVGHLPNLGHVRSGIVRRRARIAYSPERRDFTVIGTICCRGVRPTAGLHVEVHGFLNITLQVVMVTCAWIVRDMQPILSLDHAVGFATIISPWPRQEHALRLSEAIWVSTGPPLSPVRPGPGIVVISGRKRWACL